MANHKDLRFAFDMILKIYDHHKIHARFEETQRSWILTAYLTLTGFIFIGLSKYPKEQIQTLAQFFDFWIVALVMHFIVGFILMFSVSKLSGEFRRHFSKAEDIIEDVAEFLGDSHPVSSLLKKTMP